MENVCSQRNDYFVLIVPSQVCSKKTGREVRFNLETVREEYPE